MRFDTFLLHDEWDLLECRLREYKGVVDGFIAVLGDTTFTGEPIAEPFPHERFAPWADRLTLTHITLDPHSTPWGREHASREAVRDGLIRRGAGPRDIVLHGDVDEFPPREAVALIEGPVRFLPAMHYWKVDWRCPVDLHGTVAMRYESIGSFYWMREERTNTQMPEVVGGHHFAWVGTNQWRHRKLRSFSHTELVEEWEPMLDECARLGKFPDGTNLARCDVDETYPMWVRDHKAPVHWYRER